MVGAAVSTDRRYSLAIFDVDGTLLDTSEGLIAAFRRALTESGFRAPDESRLRAAIGPPFSKFVEEYCRVSEQRAQDVSNLFREIYSQSGYLMRAKPYDGIFPLCRSLLAEGVRMAAATNKRIDYARKLLLELGFGEFLDPICGTDFEYKLTKADLIGTCLTETQTPPERAVMIGDGSSDASAAEKAGVDFIGVTYGFGFCSSREVFRYGCSVACAHTVEDISKIIIGEN
ncbi:MAG: HAD hydrolase-like protein [Oscillospiraceae bacterium]|jgi:phosphoglycolate phosphatase|nr:HAD hydrolase-like protein [Oscillospiraceae bacterium]